MTILLHAFGPWWLYLGLLILVILSGILTLRGLFILVARRPSNRVLVNSLYLQGGLSVLGMALALSTESVKDLYAALFFPSFPFGMLSGLPLLIVFANPGAPSPLMALIMGSLNFLAAVTIVYFCANRFGLFHVAKPAPIRARPASQFAERNLLD